MQDFLKNIVHWMTKMRHFLWGILFCLKEIASRMRQKFWGNLKCLNLFASKTPSIHTSKHKIQILNLKLLLNGSFNIHYPFPNYSFSGKYKANSVLRFVRIGGNPMKLLGIRTSFTGKLYRISKNLQANSQGLKGWIWNNPHHWFSKSLRLPRRFNRAN